MADKWIKFELRRTEDGQICGEISGCAIHADGRESTFFTSPFGALAADEFPKAVAAAEDHGISTIDIIDPHGLFPSLGFGETRPAST